jgi:hypothetical protein
MSFGKPAARALKQGPGHGAETETPEKNGGAGQPWIDIIEG